MVTAATKLRCLLLGRKVMTNLHSIFKSRDITLPAKVRLVKTMVFPVVMYGCESWTVKKAERWRIDAFELWCWRRLLRVPWTARRSNQSILRRSAWDFFGRNDAKAETPVLWPPHVKSWLIGKNSDAGRDWGQEEKGITEDEMAGWHHWLNGRESEWTPGVGDGQGGLACCDSWGRKESDTTEWLIWSDEYWKLEVFQGWARNSVTFCVLRNKQSPISVYLHIWIILFFPVQTNFLCLFLSTCVLKVDNPRMGDGTLECLSLQFQGLHLANSDFPGSLCQYLSIAQIIMTIFKSKHDVRW